jgi:hypothetical protein
LIFHNVYFTSSMIAIFAPSLLRGPIFTILV